jgi:isocitrate dehydrogenase
MKIAVAKGDGIGPEIMEAVLKIFNANNVQLEYEYVDMGKWVFDKGFSNGMTPEAKQIIESHGILFKGPMETPKGKGVKSINVTARKTWNTYANKRVFQTLHGVDTVFTRQEYQLTLLLYEKILKILMVESSICSHMM